MALSMEIHLSEPSGLFSNSEDVLEHTGMDERELAREVQDLVEDRAPARTQVGDVSANLPWRLRLDLSMGGVASREQLEALARIVSDVTRRPVEGWLVESVEGGR